MHLLALSLGPVEFSDVHERLTWCFAQTCGKTTGHSGFQHGLRRERSGNRSHACRLLIDAVHAHY